MVRYTAQSLAKIAKARHAKHCIPDEEIYLGPLSGIDVQTCGDHSIWVESGEVYLIIGCPDKVHGRVAGSMGRDIDEALQSVGLRKVLKPSTSANQPVELESNVKFEKSPDGSYYLSRDYNKHQIYPVIVVEVAVNHKSLHRLFCEASAWLNARTDVVYCIAVKIDVKTKKAYIYLLERTQTPADKKVFIEKRPRGEETTEEIADALLASRPPLRLQAFDDERIEENYKVKVAEKLIIEQGQGHEHVFNLDIVKMLVKSSIEISEFQGKSMKLRLSEVMETLWEELGE